ncbi:hypothetical protein J6590_025202 [Homalodisca vitripennis]|nr:hypothetical protein J6590_025202 [Homalodisca vitripennis]
MLGIYKSTSHEAQRLSVPSRTHGNWEIQTNSILTKSTEKIYGGYQFRNMHECCGRANFLKLLVYSREGDSLSWRHLDSMAGLNSGHARVLRIRERPEA